MNKIRYLVFTAPLLLASCGETNTGNKKNKVQQEGNTMVRQKTASGLEYEIIKNGTGVSPRAGQSVTVHYTGWLAKDGQPDKSAKFDSSIDRGQPFSFTIGEGQVIRGWDEGVMGMKVGETRRLIIPGNLGYGARGAGRLIPPHATLVFDVELLKVS